MRKRHFLLMAVCFTQLVLAQGLQAQDGSELLNELGLQKADLTVQAATYGTQNNSLFSESAQKALRSTSGVSDVVGTLSIEDFPSGVAGDLSYTHDSADGYRTFVESFGAKTNFIFRDAGVGAWQYRDIAGGDNLDLWTYNGTDLGIDAVLSCWHSGHGGMSNNVYVIPLGSDWLGRGYYAYSSQMFLGGNNNGYGDERLRYMFWDTCDSVKVDGGNDPYSTWGTRSKGVRMVFGYTTASVDNPNYGKFFGEEWNKNKSLSAAFLDASWRVSTRQSPCVVAFGSTDAEATNICDNERQLVWGSISNAWARWKWYYAQYQAKRAPTSDEELAKASAYQMNNNNSYVEIKKIAQTLGIELQDQKSLESLPYGLKKLSMNGASLFVENNGNFELTLNKKVAATRDAAEIADSEFLAKAEKIASELSIMKDKQYQVGMIRNTNSGTRSATQAVKSTVIEKTVIFDQMLDKLAFVDAEKGHLEIRFDAHTGQVLQLKSSMVDVTPLVTRNSSAKERLTIAAARKQALVNYNQSQKTYSGTAKVKAVLESEAVGYQVINGVAQPVYQATFTLSGVKFTRPAQVVIPL